MKRLVVIIVLAGGLAVGGAAPPAAAAVTCTFVQLTDTTGLSDSNLAPSISGDGTLVAWRSNRDIVGDNADLTAEIFLYDSTATPAIRQVTDHDSFVDAPAVSGDGTAIAYLSDQDLGDNADGSGEVFLYDIATDTHTQVSDTDGFLNRTPAINGDGTRIVWRNAADGNSEIYLHDTGTDMTTQVTDTASGTSEYPSISGDGTLITFNSSANVDGSNPEGNHEVFLHDTVSDTTTAITASTSSTIGSNIGPVISASGNRIAFSTSVYNTATETTTTLDYGLGGLPTTGFPRSISADGGQIAFSSSSDVIDGPPVNHNYEIWLHEAAGPSAVTDGLDSNYHPDISADGSQIAFHSTGDLVAGGNEDGNPEIFIATCAPRRRPDALIATAAGGPYAGNNRYSASVIPAQTRSVPLARGAARNFFVRVQNDRTVADTLKVRGAASGGAGYRVAYFRGATNITAQVLAGTYTVTNLAAGASVVIKVRITATGQTRRGSVRNVDVTVRSAAAPAIKDTVRARVTRS